MNLITNAKEYDVIKEYGKLLNELKVLEVIENEINGNNEDRNEELDSFNPLLITSYIQRNETRLEVTSNIEVIIDNMDTIKEIIESQQINIINALIKHKKFKINQLKDLISPILKKLNASIDEVYEVYDVEKQDI